MCDEFVGALAVVIDHILTACGGTTAPGATICLDTSGVTRVRVPAIVSLPNGQSYRVYVEVAI